MLVLHRENSITATAAAASAVQSLTYTMQGGGTAGRALFIFVAHQGLLTDSPVTAASYGSEAATFLNADADALGNVTVECWEIDNPTTVADVITVACDSGASQSIGLFAIEVNGIGAAPGSQVANGLTSPITVSYTDGPLGGGNAAGTVGVPVTNNLQFAVGCMYSGLTTAMMSNQNGDSDGNYPNPFEIGTGVNKITMGALYQQSTGNLDTISWSETSDRPWALVEVIGQGCAIRGNDVLRAPGPLRNYYALGSRP